MNFALWEICLGRNAGKAKPEAEKRQKSYSKCIQNDRTKKGQVLRDRSSMFIKELGVFELVERILSSRKWCRSKWIARGL